jgi:hypothetical protein
MQLIVCLHGSHTSTFIANISLVWRRMGLWKYKTCCQVLSNKSEAWNDVGLDLAHGLWMKKRKIKRIQEHEDLPVMVNMDWDMY